MFITRSLNNLNKEGLEKRKKNILHMQKVAVLLDDLQKNRKFESLRAVVKER